MARVVTEDKGLVAELLGGSEAALEVSMNVAEAGIRAPAAMAAESGFGDIGCCCNDGRAANAERVGSKSLDGVRGKLEAVLDEFADVAAALIITDRVAGAGVGVGGDSEEGVGVAVEGLEEGGTRLDEGQVRGEEAVGAGRAGAFGEHEKVAVAELIVLALG